MSYHQIDDNRIRTLLQEQAVPACSDGFVVRVLEAAQHDSVRQKPALISAFSGAIAAGLAVWFIVASTLFSTSTDSKDDYQVLVSNQVQTIKVAIESRYELAEVQLSIELTPNLELAGFGSRTSINWQSRLNKGVNIINLPIIGLAAGNGNIITRVHTKGKEKVIHIQTIYPTPDEVRYQINSNA